MAGIWKGWGRPWPSRAGGGGNGGAGQGRGTHGSTSLPSPPLTPRTHQLLMLGLDLSDGDAAVDGAHQHEARDPNELLQRVAAVVPLVLVQAHQLTSGKPRRQRARPFACGTRV